MNRTGVLLLLILLATSGCHPAAVRSDGIDSPEVVIEGEKVSIPSALELTAIDAAAASLAAGAWSLAHEQVLMIDRNFWNLIEVTSGEELQGTGDLVDRLRDRTWRHLQDRLAAVDAPGLAAEQAVLIASALALSARCRFARQKLPAGFSDGVSWWQRRFQQRWRSDRSLAEVADLKAMGDLIGAWDEMERAVSECPDGQLAGARLALLEELAAEVLKEFEQAALAGDPVALLEPLRQLVRLGVSPPALPHLPEDVLGWRRWCQGKLQEQVVMDIARGASGKALLSLVKLVELGVEGVEHQVEILRGRIPRIPLPRAGGIFSSHGNELLLIDFDPVFSESEDLREVAAEVDSMGVRGKLWRRHPGHAADVQRWGKCLEELLLLSHDWWLAPAVKAPHLRQRQIFQVRRLLRLAARLEENQPRRWQTIWNGETDNSASNNQVRIRAHKRLLLLDPSGSERPLDIFEEEVLRVLPSATGISRQQRDVCLQRLNWRLEGRVERLLEDLRSEQLALALDLSRRRAQEGDKEGAIEGLVSTVISAHYPRDGALIRDAVALLCGWTGLTEASIRRALRLYPAES